MSAYPHLLLLLVAGCGLYIGDDEHLGRVDRDLDGVPASEDCDDEDPLVHEIVTWYLDADGDGLGGDITLQACNQPAGYVPEGGDCDDGDPDVQDLSEWYEDRDGDGFGDGAAVVACGRPEGHVAIDGDCDDDDPTVYPGGTEYCNGKDNDCNGVVDDVIGQVAWWIDGDGDGWGDRDLEPVLTDGCDPPHRGVLQGGDCDDADPGIHPGAQEVCDGVDNNCNGLVDDEDPSAVGVSAFYVDADGDGWGDALAGALLRCEQPDGYVGRPGDCDDANPARHPGHPEICDGIDNDCDGLVDEDDPDLIGETYYADADGDGWGDPNAPFVACSLPPGASEDNTDCDDSDPDIHPGRPAEVTLAGRGYECSDGADNDCDGLVDLADPDCGDIDGDGIPNAIDALYAFDCYGSGKRECACGVAELLLPPAWAPFDGIRAIRGESCFLGSCGPDPIGSLDLAQTDPLHAIEPDAWCWDLRGLPAETFVFRWVSSRSANDPSQPVNPNSCADWKKIDLTTACGTLGDPWCTTTNNGIGGLGATHVDDCDSGTPRALRLVWDGSSL